MRLHYDLDLEKLVQKPGYSSLLGSVDFKRGDSSRIQMCLWREQVASAPSGTPSEMIFVVKKDFLEETGSLLLANTWTPNGDFTIWTSPVGADMDALMAELGGATTKKFFAEFTFTDDDGTQTSQTITAAVSNDLWKGTEGTPLSLATPDEWLEARRPAPLVLEDFPLDTRAASKHMRALDFTDCVITADGNLLLTATDFSGGFVVSVPVLEGDGGSVIAGKVYDAWLAAEDSDLSRTAAWEFGESVVSFEAINTGFDEFFALTIEEDTAVATDLPASRALVIGCADIAGTAATALLQEAKVTRSADDITVWKCVSIEDETYLWQPVTGGIHWNRDELRWERLVISGGTLQTELLS